MPASVLRVMAVRIDTHCAYLRHPIPITPAGTWPAFPACECGGPSNIGLRKKQIQLATVEEGDVRLLQYLGQSDATGEAGNAEPVKTYQNVRIEDV